MMKGLRSITTMIALGALSSMMTVPAEGQSGSWNLDIGPSNGQIAAVVAGIAITGAAIGIGIYFLARHDHSLTGCADSGVSGLVLQKDSDPQIYALIGDTAAIKPGQRIRVAGKRKKKDASGNRTFLVEKLSKDLGPCTPQTIPPKTQSSFTIRPLQRDVVTARTL
jgi:hypothetical protein